MDRFGLETAVDQMLSQPQLQESCIDRVAVCIIAFLPNIYDSSAEQRNTYIKDLTDVIKKN